jgi:glycosyltransferase involved in cell wall biosynthesis
MSVMADDPRSMFAADQAADADDLPLVDAPVLHRTKPLVSLVLPAYNESAIVRKNLGVLCDYMKTLEHKYDCEIIVVNDGSRDDTSELAKQIAAERPNVHVLDHSVNFGLGQALKFAFNQCRGEYIVTMDMDLSYSPKHIELLVDKLRATKAKIVIASPYLEGGAVENVPAFRRLLSVWANKFLSTAAHGRIKTLTGMVRAYDARFLRTLDFYSMGMEVNAEILYKAMVLRARIEEIPATLSWHTQDAAEAAGQPVRRSSMRIVRHILTLAVSGFLYRPIMFFLLPAIACLLVTVGCGVLIGIDAFRFGSVAAAWNAAPLAFVFGSLGFIAAVQLCACGLISLQNKCYFEQMFHLGTTTYRSSRESKG